MNNKPMFSVERGQILAVCNVVEVAEKLEKEAFAKGVSNVDVGAFRSLRYALDHLSSVSNVELRALLDKPDDQCTHGDDDAACMGCLKKWGQWPIDKPAAQHQGEPVSTPFFYALMGEDGKPYYDEYCVSDEPSHLIECIDEGVTVVPLYLKPAPVSVVMPERKGQAHKDWRDWTQEEIGYNKALDDVARLNGVKP